MRGERRGVVARGKEMGEGKEKKRLTHGNTQTTTAEPLMQSSGREEHGVHSFDEFKPVCHDQNQPFQFRILMTAKLLKKTITKPKIVSRVGTAQGASRFERKNYL